MADYFWGRIQIGGDLRRQDVPQLCEAFGAKDEPDLHRYVEGGLLTGTNAEASYGRFEGLEWACREIGLPYARQSDGKYTYSPEIVLWQPGMGDPCHVLTDHDGNMQVSMDTVRAIRDALVANIIRQACDLVDRAVVDVPSLPPFRIIEGS
ncbi:MAG: hypothetical protein HN742_10540 [Lentisphaerae bacterium]|mgnify:CR=1 FL=1|jgi:hypothetical protein|nr:hypothetical protein [Lentisphaerota bacterium]MBT4821915.1 hypothetical protein [Lentisphaerota bacterium]MBT5606936.1 hypothetical protein [Lentisphaerota bacterium]MBT7055031.1 hypothetical protein [Lentisphaerota bacterium]MBT7842302.1 hypothetical protein [Lentisphaerota bacterium]